MSITSERFDSATAVVEAGVTAAMGLLNVPKDERPSAREAHALLMDGLRDADPGVDALLDLVGVATMIIAFERSASGKSYQDYAHE